MNDWKDKLKKLAEQKGWDVEASSEESTEEAQPTTRRKLIQHTREIKFDRNPKFNRWATAPYNFVPLNETIIGGECFQGFDAYDTTRYSGFIKCEIEALTPIYIRNNLTEAEFNAGKTSKEVDTFFSLAGTSCIPGSSLRGMIRNLVEIISWSKLFTNFGRFYYYRGLADMSNLREEYQSFMFSFEPGKKFKSYHMSAGYLKKEGMRYSITPARVIGGRQFYQILKSDTSKLLAKARPRDFKKNYKIFQSGGNWVIISGNMPNKRRDWVIHPPDETAMKIWLSDSDVKNYQMDDNRDAVDLIDELDKDDRLALPCFFVQWRDHDGKTCTSFGHTAMFRLSYRQPLKDLLLEDMNNPHLTDMAESIFGTVAGCKTIAGRVYFEDALLIEKFEAGSEKGIPQILSTPKPTTFQHYLVQKSDAINQLLHYNSDTFLRGHKLYWHRLADWQARDLNFPRAKLEEFLQNKRVRIPPDHVRIDRNKFRIINFPTIKDQNIREAIFEFVQKDPKSQYTVIETLPDGTKFTGRIGFENLTDVELGALLFALDLPENCCHKLGMGKPLGLGSVKIIPELYLSKRKERYTSLRAEWVDKVQPENQENIKTFKETFEKFILDNLNIDEKPQENSLWETYRLRQLKTLLDWKNTDLLKWNEERTRYMEIERYNPVIGKIDKEFRTRRVLPIPEDVVGKTS